MTSDTIADVISSQHQTAAIAIGRLESSITDLDAFVGLGRNIRKRC